MQTNSRASLPSPDERIAGALAHIGALIPAIGLLIPVLIWITQKDRSHFAGFQALQAAAYQLLLLLASFLGWGCYVGSFLLSFVLLALTKNSLGWAANLPFFIPFSILLVMGVGWLVFIIYATLAAILTFRGRDFRYLVVGSLVDGFLQK